MCELPPTHFCFPGFAMGDSFAVAKYRLTSGGYGRFEMQRSIRTSIIGRKLSGNRRDNASPGSSPAPVALGYLRSLRILYLPCSSALLCLHPIPNGCRQKSRVQQKTQTDFVTIVSYFTHRFTVFEWKIPMKNGFSGKRNGNPCDYMKLAIAGRSRCYQGAVFIRSLIQACNPKAVRVFWLYYMIQHRESRTFSCNLYSVVSSFCLVLVCRETINFVLKSGFVRVDLNVKVISEQYLFS
jgi:hypothetical protein